MLNRSWAGRRADKAMCAITGVRSHVARMPGLARGIGVLLLAVVAAMVPVQASSAADGWTDFLPSADSRIVYVSSSQGNDANDGLSPQSPVRTLNRGYQLLRDGYPDWMLLKRGDVWNEGFNGSTGPYWAKNGRSAAEPMRLSSYGPGAARPQLLTNMGFQATGASRSNVAVTGIHFKSPSGGGEGVRVVVGNGANWLFEDCMIERFKDNMNLQAMGGTITNFRIRRCVIVDAASIGAGHSQGIYADRVYGLIIEECVLDHNGWSQDTDPGGAGYPTIFNHNAYIQSGCANVVFRRNIVGRGSSHGIQLRPGGVIEDNLFVRNALSILLGGGDPHPDTANGVTGSVHRNVVLEGRDIHPTATRGFGIDVTNIASAVVTENVVGHVNANQPQAITLLATGYGSGIGVHDTEVRDNTVYKWGGTVGSASVRFIGTADRFSNITFRDNNVQLFCNSTLAHHSDSANLGAVTSEGNRFFTTRSGTQWFLVGGSFMALPGWMNLIGDASSLSEQLGYTDPERTVASYNASQGGSATFEAFMQEARQQSRANWRPQYAAPVVNAYIRSGFGLN
jgi:hypothetical protein